MKIIDKIDIEDIDNNVLFSLCKQKLENSSECTYNISIKDDKCYKFSSFKFNDRIKLIINLLRGHNDVVYTSLRVKEQDIKQLHQSLLKMINMKG